jgi:hypothetical protein
MHGQGRDLFETEYCVLPLHEATKKAYGVIFDAAPSDVKVEALLSPAFSLGGVSMTRAEYFEMYGQHGPDGIGTKAAMVGCLLKRKRLTSGSYARLTPPLWSTWRTAQSLAST